MPDPIILGWKLEDHNSKVQSEHKRQCAIVHSDQTFPVRPPVQSDNEEMGQSSAERPNMSPSLDL